MIQTRADAACRAARPRSSQSARAACLALLFAVAFPLTGCQSVRSWSSGCPGIYSGVRYFRDQVSWLPVDGKIFFTFDLPFSVVVDTVALPVTAFADPQVPTGGFAPGCRWVAGN